MNLVIFQAYRMETKYPVIWFPAPGVKTARIERVFLAKQLLDIPRAKGRG
jgi:hypothetical protein